MLEIVHFDHNNCSENVTNDAICYQIIDSWNDYEIRIAEISKKKIKSNEKSIYVYNWKFIFIA